MTQPAKLHGAMPSIFAITGPTACGKTAAALALAREIPIEIISVDSALVYRGMDIGTAKPSISERALVPHHLIDIREPFEQYNTADFLKDTLRLVNQIRERGNWPVLVGGTMLYLKTLLHGIDDMPVIDPRWREQLRQEALQIGWPALHERLLQLDPRTAARLAPNDAQRISRALEVVLETGQTLSSLQTGQPKPSGLLQESAIISLEPHDRAWLHERISLRFSAMLDEGLVDEVWRLIQDPRIRLDSPAMRCVGYRQVLDQMNAYHLPIRAQLPRELTAKQRQQAFETGSAATRQLAKRQLTWLRSMPARKVVACDQGNAIQKVLDFARTLKFAPD